MSRAPARPAPPVARAFAPGRLGRAPWVAAYDALCPVARRPLPRPSAAGRRPAAAAAAGAGGGGPRGVAAGGPRS